MKRSFAITFGTIMNISASALLDATWHAPRISDWGREAWGHSDFGFTAWSLRVTGIALVVWAVYFAKEQSR